MITILGLAIGYATGAESAFGMLYAVTTVLSALGGLWMPLSILPTGLQTVGKLLPTYRAADLGWRLIAGQTMDFSSVLILLAWTAAFTLLVLLFSGRKARSR